MEKKLKNKPLFFLILLGAAAFVMFGCGDDFFNETAGDRITPDQHYRTLEDASVSLRGAIIPLQDILPRLILLDGLRSDMMDITTNTDAHLRNIHYQMFAIDNPYTDPADLYKVIININEVLEHIDLITERDRKFDALTAHAYKGALIGMRAWTYLTLANLYGKVFYIQDNMASLPDNLSQTVLEKDVLIDTLIEQLKPYIHDTSSGAQMEELRISNYVNNKAVLGELYLEKNDFANAVVYLKMACESYLNQPALLKVDRTYQNAAWSSIFLNAESSTIENISVMPYSSREDQYNPLAYWMGYEFNYVVKPSSVLVDSFMMQLPPAGAPGDLWRGAGVSFMIDTLGQLSEDTYLTNAYITKYAVDVADPFSSDIIISRAADIHLLLAEALNRLGDPVSQDYALMLLNNGVNGVNPKPAPYVRWSSNLGIRGRVYLKPRLVPEDLSGIGRTYFIEDLIIAERAMELAFEGKRWNDLVRVATRRSNPAFLADKVAEKFKGTSEYNMIREKLMDPANWYLPFE